MSISITSKSQIEQRAEEAGLRICFIADGRDNHATRWIEFFKRRGHEVALISAHPPEDGLEVDAYYPLSKRSRIPGLRLLQNVIEVRRALRDFQADVLQTHFINEPGWLGAMSGFHPFVLTALGSDVYLALTQSKLARVLTPWTVRRADYVTADSHDQIERLQEMGAAASVTEMITWGVELDKFTNCQGDGWREKYGIDRTSVVILSPRRWIENSNIDVVVDAFAIVHAQRPNTVLVLKRWEIDSEPENASPVIEARVKAHGITDSTRVVHYIPEDELPSLYAAADITVSICSSDGTPVSVLEAMASESATVVCDLPSLTEWVEHGVSGFVVPPRDVDQLAACLLRLTDDSSLRGKLGRNARIKIESKANRTSNLERVENAYRRLTSGMHQDSSALTSSAIEQAISAKVDSQGCP